MVWIVNCGQSSLKWTQMRNILKCMWAGPSLPSAVTQTYSPANPWATPSPYPLSHTPTMVGFSHNDHDHELSLYGLFVMLSFIGAHLSMKTQQVSHPGTGPNRTGHKLGRNLGFH